MNEGSPAVPVAAATLLLVRDGAQGLEVLMAARHEQSGFAAGALVFPGGKVDAADLMLARRCGLADVPETAAAARVAAIRETWEECGILVARQTGSAALLSGERVRQLHDRYGKQFGALVDDPTVELAADRVLPFAHWITPVDRPKRFDTLFFIAPFDGDQAALHDGREAIATRWIRPDEAIAEADEGRLKLVFATRINLLRLAEMKNVADALASARNTAIIAITPEIVKTAAGPALRIPADAGYPVSELPLDKVARA